MNHKALNCHCRFHFIIAFRKIYIFKISAIFACILLISLMQKFVSPLLLQGRFIRFQFFRCYKMLVYILKPCTIQDSYINIFPKCCYKNPEIFTFPEGSLFLLGDHRIAIFANFERLSKDSQKSLSDCNWTRTKNHLVR